MKHFMKLSPGEPKVECPLGKGLGGGGGFQEDINLCSFPSLSLQLHSDACEKLKHLCKVWEGKVESGR